MIDVPIIRGGEEYYTRERIKLSDYKGEELAEVSQAPTALIFDSISKAKKSFENLQKLSLGELFDIIKEAGKKFKSELKCGKEFLSYQDYCEAVTKATGLPMKAVKDSSRVLVESFSRIDEIIKRQTPYELKIYDDFIHEDIAFVPKGKVLGIISPGNLPAPNFFLVTAQAVKYPVIHRPSNTEPFTGQRITKALYNAQLPKNVNHYIPCKVEEVSGILTRCDFGLIFGSKETVEQYKNIPSIRTYGPGNCKILIDPDHYESNNPVELIEASMMDKGGRSCLNASQLIVISDEIKKSEKLLQEIADSLADKISYEILDPMDEDATIPAIPDKQVGEKIDEYIDSNLSNGFREANLEQRGKRLIEDYETQFLQPTLVICNWRSFKRDGNRFTHPLFIELPFQYLAMVAVPKELAISFLKDSLVVSVLTYDEKLMTELILEPTIEKLYFKKPTIEFDFSDPHYEYFIDFLYKVKCVKH